ncbi:MAG: dihydroorotate dehydrogenase [Desulfurococcaceae archaeon]|jgi:dihydroorotate dehydrogenase (NAD+) catalytic subunit|nr:dihydroorotate dehydrogenase [Desulfurococcaceae archaeon]
MSLAVDIAGLRLKHPVMNASGILGSYREHIARLASYGVSAVVTKTITPKPREGYNPPIIVELPTGGLLNAVGLENPGKDIVEELVSEAKKFRIPIIVSVGGRNEEEFVEVAVKADTSNADAVELNLSCPHAKGYGIEIGSDPHIVYNVVKAVSSTVKIPVIAKLGLCDKVVDSAIKALEAGARALTLINTVKAMYIDVYTAKPFLTNIFGGLSGPPIHPIAVRVVYEVYRETKAEIIGCGGIYDWATAAEMILAGARAVQVGTALMKNPREVVENIVKGLRLWIEMLSLQSIEQAVGLAHKL